MIKVKSSTEQKNEGGSPRALFFIPLFHYHSMARVHGGQTCFLGCTVSVCMQIYGPLQQQVRPRRWFGRWTLLLWRSPPLCFVCCLCTAGLVSVLEALQRASVRMRSLRASGFQLCSLRRHLARDRHRRGGGQTTIKEEREKRLQHANNVNWKPLLLSYLRFFFFKGGSLCAEWTYQLQ